MRLNCLVLMPDAFQHKAQLRHSFQSPLNDLTPCTSLLAILHTRRGARPETRHYSTTTCRYAARSILTHWPWRSNNTKRQTDPDKRWTSNRLICPYQSSHCDSERFNSTPRYTRYHRRPTTAYTASWTHILERWRWQVADGACGAGRGSTLQTWLEILSHSQHVRSP